MPAGRSSPRELIQPSDLAVERPGVARALTVAGLVVALVPLLIAAVTIVVKWGPHYIPADDVAGIEVKVRDIGHHPVLLGLYSRDRWSHPGPAMFYALAVPYHLSGGSSLSLHVGALLINGACIAGMALIARRHGGLPIMLLTLLGCAVLVHSFGPSVMSSPWNPDLPVFPFGLVLFLTWAMLCGDLWPLPFAVAATTFCVQTHIGYVLLAVPIFAIGVGGWVRSVQQRRAAGGEAAESDGAARAPSLLRWGVPAALILVVMWVPPVIQQVNHTSAGHHGNLGNIVDYFVHPTESLRHSFAQGYRLISGQFGLAPRWLTGRVANDVNGEPLLLDSAPLPVWLVPFVVAVTVLWRRRVAAANRLALVVSVLLVLGVVWVARTPGTVYGYRIGWTWILAMAAFVLMAWALTTVSTDALGRVARRAVVAASCAGLVAFGVVGGANAARVKPSDWSKPIPSLTRQVVENLPPRSGDVIVRCEGESCITAAGLFLGLEKRGVRPRADTEVGLISSDAQHLVHRKGPVRAWLRVEIGQRFDAQLLSPQTRLIAYVSDVPLPLRREVVRKSAALDAAYNAGRMSETAYFLEKVSLPKVGPAQGVFIDV